MTTNPRPGKPNRQGSATTVKSLAIVSWLVLTLGLPAGITLAQTPCPYPYSADSDTVALWHFDETEGTTVQDETGLHHGEVQGTSVTTQGPFGTARLLGAPHSGDYITIPQTNNLDALVEVSVEMWLYPTGAFELQDIIGKGQHTGVRPNDANLAFALSTFEVPQEEEPGLRFQFYLGYGPGPNAHATSTITHPLNEWLYLVGTYDGERARLYVNGELEVESSVAPGISVSNGHPVFINAHQYPTFTGMNLNGGGIPGAFDEVRISRRARSASEIAFSYQALSGVCDPDGPSLQMLQIPSSQTVGEEIPITLRSLSSLGVIEPQNGRVHITSTLAAVSPFALDLADGEVVGNVVLDSCGEEMQLHASGLGMGVSSNPFSVTGCGEDKGKVVGRVTISGTSVPAIGDVYLDDGKSVRTMSFTEGRYQTALVPCGLYALWATGPGSATEKRGVNISCGRTLRVDLVLKSTATAEVVPVLFVPGLLGSTTNRGTCVELPPIPLLPDTSPPIPTLPEAIDWNSSDWPATDWLDEARSNESQGGLHCLTGWRDLALELISRDPQYSAAIYPAPYDWKNGVAMIAASNLKKRIDQIKADNPGVTQVDIVAHSMGGLVARQYIQGPRFENDVRRLALVGTPNQGVTGAYYLWAGGQPLEVGLPLNARITYEFVTLALLAEFDPVLRRLVKACAGELITGFDACPFLRPRLSRFYRQYVFSLKDLLPVYPFLDYGSGLLEPLNCERNTWLESLNADGGKARLTGGENSVDTRLFIGLNGTTEEDSKATPYARRVGERDCGRSAYRDGEPRRFGAAQDVGDGTVRRQSVFIPGASAIPMKEGVGEHATLVGDLACEIANFLAGTEAQCEATSMTETVAEEEPQSSGLGVQVTGRQEVLLVDPLLRSTGVDPSTQEMRDEIPQGGSSITPFSGSFGVADPEAGTYELRLRSLYDEQFGLSLSYSGSENPQSALFMDGMNHAEALTVRFLLDPLAQEPLQILEPIAGPEGVVADAAPGAPLATQLSWSPHPEAVEYRVYGRKSVEPKFVFLGTTANASFDTGHEWAVSDSVPTHLFAVTAVDSLGDESFLSELVANDDRDHDGLTDQEEFDLGLPADDSDADNDGLSDGEEIGLGTNPLVVDSDGDGFSDLSEVEAGSDPLSPDSTPDCLAGEELVLAAQTIDTPRRFQACNLIRAGSGFVISEGGDAVLESGGRVVLEDGFNIREGGRLRVQIDPELAGPTAGSKAGDVK